MHTVAAPHRWGEPKPPPVPWAVGWPRGCGLHTDIVEQASLGSAGRRGTGVNPKSLPAPLFCARQLWEEPQHWDCCLLSVLQPTTSELPAERDKSKFLLRLFTQSKPMGFRNHLDPTEVCTAGSSSVGQHGSCAMQTPNAAQWCLMVSHLRWGVSSRLLPAL